MVQAYVRERSALAAIDNLVVNLPEHLLLTQFQNWIRAPHTHPYVVIFPTDSNCKGILDVEQYFPFNDYVEMQYKAMSGALEIPRSVLQDRKGNIESLVAKALTNPVIRIGLKDSSNQDFDPGDVEGDPDDWAMLNAYLWITIKNGKLSRLHARPRHALGGNDSMYDEVLKHFVGTHYNGKLNSHNIGRLNTQEVVQDVLTHLAPAVEKRIK